MTADELSDLNGLVALEAADRARAGDSRDQREIADDILREIDAPSVAWQVGLLTDMMHERYRPQRASGDPPYRVVP